MRRRKVNKSVENESALTPIEEHYSTPTEENRIKRHEKKIICINERSMAKRGKIVIVYLLTKTHC